MAMGWKAGGSNAGRVKQREQTSRPAGGTTLPPIQGHRGYFPGVKGPACDTDHSPPSSAEVENEWSHTCTPPTCLRSVDRWNFTFTNTTKCQRCMFTIRSLLLVHNILVSVGMKWASVTKSRFQLAIGSKLRVRLHFAHETLILENAVGTTKLVWSCGTLLVRTMHVTSSHYFPQNCFPFNIIPHENKAAHTKLKTNHCFSRCSLQKTSKIVIYLQQVSPIRKSLSNLSLSARPI